MNKFGENLVALRKAAGFSQKHFAQMLGIPITTLSGYENSGREPKLDLLIKMAAFLNVSIDDLIRGNENDTVLNSVRMAAEKRERRLATLNKLADFFEDTIDDLVVGKVKIEFKNAEDNQ